MVYEFGKSLDLGPSATGQTARLRAQLYDSTGGDVGSEIDTGFVEITPGGYHWHYENFPDGFRGGVYFYNSIVGSALADRYGFTDINPEEGEYINNYMSVAIASADVAAENTGSLVSRFNHTFIPAIVKSGSTATILKLNVADGTGPADSLVGSLIVMAQGTELWAQSRQIVACSVASGLTLATVDRAFSAVPATDSPVVIFPAALMRGTDSTDIPAAVQSGLTAQGYTALRGGYLANLNVGGLVASSAEATAIQNNTRAVRVVPDVLERPDSGSTSFRVELFLYDEIGNMEAPDAAPTIAVVNQAGTSRSANLDSTTMTLVSAGRYRSTYTVDTAHALEELVFTFSVVEGSVTRVYGNGAQVVDTTAVDFTAADRTDLQSIISTLTAIKGVGWATETLKAIYDQVILRLLTTGYTTPPTAVAVSTQVAADLQTAHGAGLWQQGNTTTPPTVVQIRTELEGAGTKLTNADAVATKLNAMIEGTTPDFAFDVAALANAPSGGGGGADPLLNEVPGDYDEGTAGFNLGLLPGINTKAQQIGAGTVQTRTPMQANGDFGIIPGNHYDAGVFTWGATDGSLDEYVGLDTTLVAIGPGARTWEHSATVTNLGNGTVEASLTEVLSAETEDLKHSAWTFALWVEIDGTQHETPIGGTMTVLKTAPLPA